MRDVPAALGGRARGDRLERMRRSPQYRDGAFHNAAGVDTTAPPDPREVAREWNAADMSSGKPAGPIPVVDAHAEPAPTRPPSDAFGILWYGHASSLLEIEGKRILIDPVWSQRCSPSQRVGPRRLHRVPAPLENVPAVDAILISHDHYDHLDMETVKRLTRERTAPFVVPLGIGAHLERWGVPDSRIVELDWEERFGLGGVDLILTPAQHFSGRAFSRNDTLWGSWVVAGSRRRAFYSGDSGYFDGYARIGEKHGPFDVTLMQIGAYSSAWPHVHMTPEEAVQAHIDVKGGLLVPVHWCTFHLSFHAWSEPVDLLWREAKSRDVRLATPRPGEVVDVAEPRQADGWWQTVT
ncbi:MAG: MBL fold metallo-hydrolase [Stackebrandtia sp.]